MNLKDMEKNNVPKPVKRLKLKSSGAVPDETTKFNYYILSIPKECSDQQKDERLAELVDTIAAVQGSDVICFSMWVPTGE
jgi:hypothetical protein